MIAWPQQVLRRTVGLFMLLGCATTRPAAVVAPSPLLLSDAMLAAHKGDLASLYDAWLLPRVNQDTFIPSASKAEQLAAADAIKDGFGRFCASNAGVVSARLIEFGSEYRCAAADGAFAGLMEVTRIKGNMLYVKIDSPGLREGRATAERSFEKRRSQNGPTGWLVTDKGRVKFLRLGTLAERHVVEVELENAGETVPIEEIARIDFHPTCCDFDVKLKDGRRKTRNMSSLRHRGGPNMSSTYGAGKFGLPVVVIDPESGQPYTRLFSNFVGVRSIEPDPNAASWSALPGGSMATSFQLASQTGADRYTQQLRKRAKQLHAEATSDGWIKLLPEGKLTPQLSRHLESELRALSSASACEGDEVAGVADLEAFAQCRVAARELKLVVQGGYSLVVEVTPLSTIIVLEKLKHDLR